MSAVAEIVNQTWETIANKYREQTSAKIPSEWLLPSSITSTVSETSVQNVLSIPRTCGILSEQEIEITEKYDAVTLAEMLKEGKVKSVDVTRAFCKRAAVAQQLTYCLTETMFDEALERAKYCDDYLAKEGKPLGPLHGLPISLKDSFNVKGFKSTIGYVSFIANEPSTTNSALVSILLNLGAVLYVKTNIPQTLMTADSQNNIFLRTLNPNSLHLTAGGSSGGEGALSALKGSILGVGTDIAGSIRIPAYCNGVTGFKPSTRRIPYGGQTGPGRVGSWAILASAGPICRSVSDAHFFCKSVLSADCWVFDETVVSAPWRYLQPMGKRLKLGYLKEHARWPLSPTLSRVFDEATKALSAAGHVMVDIEPLLPKDIMVDAMVTAFKMFSLDPKQTPFSIIKKSGEPIIPSIGTIVVEEMKGFVPDLDAVWDLNVEAKAMKEKVRDLWVKEGLDAILMPVYQGTAPKHDNYGAPPYTVFANLLDYPSVSIPFLKSNKKLDEPYIRKGVTYAPAYESEACEGVPGGLQILGRNMRDEECLDVAGVVESILRMAERKIV
ncbi:amidase [Mollisia scopiformis]|uniref:Amidase n=1 Tax=Mollisia scopiformis TaxID=149040 RepID=A0A132B805_MOLSC|nr:amidase [Mollisia scopiformis]KUJ08532.1 amidase [Mollisia scopiformis]